MLHFVPSGTLAAGKGGYVPLPMLSMQDVVCVHTGVFPFSFLFCSKMASHTDANCWLIGTSMRGLVWSRVRCADKYKVQRCQIGTTFRKVSVIKDSLCYTRV